jgi:hypothetical protein
MRTRLDWAIDEALCVWWLMSGWEPEDRDAISEAWRRAGVARRGSITGHGE